MKKHRFYFKACQQTFITKTPYIQPRSTISNKVKRLMTRKLTKFTSEKDVAKRLCVSPSTVDCHLKEVSNSVKTYAHDALPEHLAFDEFKSTKDIEGPMSFIYCDSVTHDIIDILPNLCKHSSNTCPESQILCIILI
ncbi:transposase [Staphylococcus pseudintermedius]|nr:transposase [Staphylococcus pseudintermedius]